MTIKTKTKCYRSVVDYFKELPFYNRPIKKKKLSTLKTLIFELRFYEELSIIKTNLGFRGYAVSYKVEIIMRKDPINQLEVSKSCLASKKTCLMIF